MFLFVGFKMTSKSTGIAAMAGTAVKGLAMGGAGLVAGAVGGAAVGGARALDQKVLGGAGAAAGQAISRNYGQVLERTGLRATGSTASANSKEVDSRASLMAKEYAAAKATGDTGSINRIQKQAMSGRGAQGAAAMKVVTDAKDLSDVFKKPDGSMDLQAASRRLRKAEISGAVGNTSAAEKLDPRLRGHNSALIKKKMDDDAFNTGPRLTEAAAKQQLVDEGFQKANVSDIRNFSPDTLKDKAFVENTSARNLEFAGREMSASQIAAMKTHADTGGYLETQRKETRSADRYKEVTQKQNVLKTL
jgi:hypothetical protein